MSIIIFLLVLFVLVLVHEWGHFIVAKKTGMRVDEFGIGFPPKLFSLKKGETEYTFNALPIGGFVKIWGENYADAAEAEKAGENIDRSFAARPKWAQALVLVAGVTMNILFAWFLFSLTYMIGFPTAVDEAVATDSAELYITQVIKDGPAAAIPPGAVVTVIESSVGQVENPTPTEFSNLINLTAPEEVKLTYKYKDQTFTAELTPVQGLIEKDKERFAVGTALAMVEVVRQPFFTSVINGLSSTWNGFLGITKGLWSLISQAFTGQADFSQVAGPIGIVGMVGEAASFGLTALLSFTAIISLNLAVINLLPFPALDGGRLLFVAIETATRRQIPPEWAGRVNLAGFAILMLLMIAVTYNDIVRLL